MNLYILVLIFLFYFRLTKYLCSSLNYDSRHYKHISCGFSVHSPSGKPTEKHNRGGGSTLGQYQAFWDQHGGFRCRNFRTSEIMFALHLSPLFFLCSVFSSLFFIQLSIFYPIHQLYLLPFILLTSLHPSGPFKLIYNRSCDLDLLLSAYI